MALKTALIAAFAVVLAAGAAAWGARAAEPSASDMMLAPAEVRDLTKKAEAGDKEAAVRLSIHYDASKRPAEASKWLVQAAKLGDCGAAETVLATPQTKATAETHKLAQTYAAKWACKPGDQLKLPPAPVMY